MRAKRSADTSDDKPRKKRKRACDRCHRLHKRCDGKRPCSTCNSKGVDCVYSDRKLNTIAWLQQEINDLRKKIGRVRKHESNEKI
jgi:hypothetical protein